MRLPFTTSAVTFITLVTYTPIIVILVYIHETLLSYPSQQEALAMGIDLDQAWTDLETVVHCP